MTNIVSSKEIVEIPVEDKDLSSFVRKLIDAGQLRVRVGGEIFNLKATAEAVSPSGRAFLTSNRDGAV